METIKCAWWLVEFVGSIPCPVYARDNGFIQTTCDPYEAKWFETKELAEQWMHRSGIIGFSEPWRAIEHSFG